MDPAIYNAAAKGITDVLAQKKDQLEKERTPNGKTVLHLAALFHDGAACTRAVLAAHPPLLRCRNFRGETPLHVAARKGRSKTVEAIIESAKALAAGDDEAKAREAKELLRATDEEGDTAAHGAVLRNHVEVVELILKEDPEFPFAANKAGETPLYLAAERGYHQIVTKILGTCASPAYGGPNCRTVLHAAVISGSKDCIMALLIWKKNLTKEADSHGWTPLHCAARLNFVESAKTLIIADKSAAHMAAENDDKNTPLHVAVSRGHVEVTKEILSRCPDCWEVVNDKGRNILHVAVEHEKKRAISFIMEAWWFSELVNQKDCDGNTPVHLLATSKFFVEELVSDDRVDLLAFNKNNLTPRDVALCVERSDQGIMNKELKKAGAPWGWRVIVTDDREELAKMKRDRLANNEETTKQQNSSPSDSLKNFRVGMGIINAGLTLGSLASN